MKIDDIENEGMDGEYPDPSKPPLNIPAKPFLKRKTVTVKNSNQTYKPQGKSKIDCWQNPGSDRNQIIIGGKGQKRQRQSLLKRNQQSAKKSRYDENPYQVAEDAENPYQAARSGNVPPMRNQANSFSRQALHKN